MKSEGQGLVVQGLTLAYPGFVARYDLTVPAGAFCALIGPSGGGKTTLLHALAGFEHSASGSAFFNGVRLDGLAPAQRPVTILFQDHNLFEHLDAFANVALGLRPSLRLDEAERHRVSEALARVGLAGKDSRKPGALSGGERQRVALARALVRERKLLLLDEPFGALDPGLRRDMIGLVDALRRENGATILLSLHTPEDMRGHADMAAFIAEGRVALTGNAAQILGGGLDPRLDAYLGQARPACSAAREA